MRARRKALQEARKHGALNHEIPYKVAPEEFRDGTNPNDSSQLENVGGPGPKISNSGHEEALSQPEKPDSHAG